MSSKVVTVIGCGPAGLLAAHAAERMGAQVRVIGPAIPSKMSGALYLHGPIEGLTLPTPECEVAFRKMGTAAGYAQKLYGDPDAATSWDRFPDGSLHPAWNAQRVYELLWERWEGRLHTRSIKAEDLPDLRKESDLVICTAPMPAMCLKPEEHAFRSRPIYITEQQSWDSLRELESWVVYDGTPGNMAARTSLLWGNLAVEYPFPREGAVLASKPTGHTCDCHTGPGWLACGRLGAWNKDVLLTDAYEEVRDAVRDL